MPGGRLTQQDRQQIALGLAEGLAYAEIARGLDRPTSTITREVMRNGGPAEYRADLAHRATEQRAHRRRPAAPPRGAAEPAPSRTGATPRPCGRTRAVHHRHDAVGPAQDDVPGDGRAAPDRRRQPDGVRARPAPPGQPGDRLQVDRVLESQTLIRRERDERRRERYVVDADVWYQSMIASVRSSSTRANSPGRASASSAPAPRPAPAWRTSPASSTSSPRTSPAPPSRPARSSPRRRTRTGRPAPDGTSPSPYTHFFVGACRCPPPGRTWWRARTRKERAGPQEAVRASVSRSRRRWPQSDKGPSSSDSSRPESVSE